jgi:hypothetical protein
MTFSTHPILLALACLAASAGCSGSFRYCLRLQTGSGVQGIEAEQCNRECKRGHDDVEYEYLRCLQACPGVAITQNDRCRDGDFGPGKICRVTDMELEGAHSDTPGVAKTLAGVAAIAMIGLAAASEGRGSSSSSESEGESTSSGSSASSGSGSGKRPASASPSHKPAEAGKQHKPAKASKSD